MSSFTKPLKVEILDDFKYKILEEFEYHVGGYPSKDIIKVPEGFVTDFASIPRLFWSLIPPNGKYTKATVIHDYLYTMHNCNKKEADLVFYEGMKVLGVNKITAFVMYKAVDLFGSHICN